MSDKILITGGAGFIGSHIADFLIKCGHYVVILDNLSNGHINNVPLEAEFIKGDIRSEAVCQRACRGVNHIFHLAAIASVPRSFKEPNLYNDINIHGTLNILKAASKFNVRRLIFSSSSSIYGNALEYPVNEEAKPLLMSPYALSKLAGEYYCKIYAEHFGVETICLRYFNVFGERQSARDEYSAVIPNFIDRIYHKQSPIIYGDGTQSRNFTHVSNIVNASYLACFKLYMQHEIFNVHADEEISVLYLAKEIARIMGEDQAPIFTEQRQGDIERSCGNIDKIKKELNYSPSVRIREGLRKTIAYFERIKQ